jgi:hypothetical protein
VHEQAHPDEDRDGHQHRDHRSAGAPAAVVARVPAGVPARRRRLPGRAERRRLRQVAEQTLQVDPGLRRVRGLDAGVVLVLVEPAGGVVLAERGDRLLPLGVADPEQVRGQGLRRAGVRLGLRQWVGHRRLRLARCACHLVQRADLGRCAQPVYRAGGIRGYGAWQ